MSSYLNCIVEKFNDKTNKWESFINEGFHHFTGGARDIINHNINMDYNKIIVNEGLPKNITELTLKKTKEYAHSMCWVTYSQLQNIVYELEKKIQKLINHPTYSSIEVYLEEAKLDIQSKKSNKTCDKLEKMITSIIKNPKNNEKKKINGIIDYLRDFYEYRDYELEEEIGTINQAIKELNFVLYSIEFKEYCYDEFQNIRIIFYTD